MTDADRVVQALGDPLTSRLLSQMEASHLVDGETLLEVGTPSPWLYVVIEGELEVQRPTTDKAGNDGKPMVLGALQPGALVGEIGFLDGGPATATLVARGPVRLLRLGPDVLETLLAETPELAGDLLGRITATMAARLDQTGEALLTRFPSERPPTRRARLRRLFGQLLGAS